MAAIPASLGCYVQSLSTPTSSVPAKRAAAGCVPRAKKLLSLEVNRRWQLSYGYRVQKCNTCAARAGMWLLP